MSRNDHTLAGVIIAHGNALACISVGFSFSMDMTEIARLRFDRPPIPEYKDHELAPLMLEFLKANAGKGYTQNHVQHHFCDPEHTVTYPQAGRVLGKLADAGEIVLFVTDDPKRNDWKQDGKTHKFYFYAPERLKLDRAGSVEQRHKIIKQEIKQYIFDHDDCSESMIRQAMTAVFICMGVSVLRQCLAELVESGEITTKTGARRAILHRIP